MTSFFAYTRLTSPGLHMWRVGTSHAQNLRPVSDSSGPDWVEFRCDPDPKMGEPLRFMLFSYEDDSPGEFEDDAYQRELPRLAHGDFPDAVWFADSASRVVLKDPSKTKKKSLLVHLLSQSRFRPGEMYLWDPVSEVSRRISQSGEDSLGPFFEVTLHPEEQSFFNFKFIRQNDEGRFRKFEPDYANRWWVADDGSEIWTHSSTAPIASTAPERRRLKLHYLQSFDAPATMRLWAENGDYEKDFEVIGAPTADGWATYETQLYTHFPYGCLFWNATMSDKWEHAEAKREQMTIEEDTEWWTLEGDRRLFKAPPSTSARLNLTVANTDLSMLAGTLFAHAWVNRARGPLTENVRVDPHGRVSLQTYPDVVTSIKFHDNYGRWEEIDRHSIHLSTNDSPASRYAVLERPPLLKNAPAADMVDDPPFRIRRPGAYAEGAAMRFVLHSPQAASVDVIGEWTDWLTNRVPMKSTRDGTYWWATVPIHDFVNGLVGGQTDYHGVKYQFLFNQEDRLQDPAAGWVEESNPMAESKLVRQDRFVWHDHHWDRPGWESLIIYQIHPSRFTNRFQTERPLIRIARELQDNAGYFRELGITAVQLMPVNEVPSTNSWGYDPVYFYAVENAYCGDDGPDDLKQLVDTCHANGLAVILDVVFNHTGSDDNILWQVARQSFFDGDTKWGSMINFDHPQVRHFFAQNLVYLANEFHIDGFRLDHTGTIVHSAAWDDWSSHIRILGSGGGWEFLHALRHAVVSQVGSKCILTAEHLPNEWSLTNYGGSMDSQWCDDFHDRMVDACRREFGMSRLADALKLSQTACDVWYNVVNYPESHDEVGNVRDRVAHIAGIGQGWRMSKVAAAGTLMSRGIPLFFMGAESGEDKQFRFGKSDQLDIDEYLANADRCRIRHWWRELCRLRRDPSIQGPSPLKVRLAEQQLLAFTRGDSENFYVLLNFGGWSGYRSLASLNLPYGEFRELWNSTWPAFAIRAEHEGEHTNGGRDARLHGHHSLNIPDYGAVILQRV